MRHSSQVSRPLFAAAALACLAGLGMVGLVPSGAAAQPKSSSWLTTNFQARTHYSTPRSDSMKYRLYVPAGYNPAQKYPIVIALHGIGERGYDNSIQLTREELAQPWVRDSVQAKHPHFVMVPQCPTNQLWWPSATWSGNRSKPNIMITEALDSLKRAYSLDTTRFYIVGLSMGGFGTIELMKWRPELWAAAIPTAGGGDTGVAAVPALVQTPMWAFHSLRDPTVNAMRGSRWIVTKIENAGKQVVRFASDSGRTNIVPFDSSRPETLVSLDSLRKAVYVHNADFLYSEVRNYPGSGNPLHQAGWWEAWRHPMVTDWLFSKRKVNGVSVVSISAEAAATKHRPMAPEGVRVVFRDGQTLLEKSVDGSKALFTLEGKKVTTEIGSIQ